MEKQNLATGKIGFLTHFKNVIEARTGNQLDCFNYDIALKHLENFCDHRDLRFDALSKNWFESVQSYLYTAKGLRSDKLISTTSANTYFRIIISVARNAADERLLDHKVISGLSCPRQEKRVSAALTLDELQLLAMTPYRLPALKNAFLFSCLTGLQWKEMSTLQWSHVRTLDGAKNLVVKREQAESFLPLNPQAYELMGNERSGTDHIFKLHYSAAFCINLNQWALKAGVLKKITFNTARVTFGKMLLDRAVAIELVSELLGHKHIRTTKRLYDCSASQAQYRRCNVKLFARF